MLDKLIVKIQNNQVIKNDFFDNYDLDELLDMRDDEVFDSEWMRIYNILNQVEMDENQKKVIDSIRELSFLMAYNLSESSDIASCVSDDFELICKAYVIDYDDNWLNSLIMSYAKGEFPCGRLNVIKYNVQECLNILFQ